jgi:hypothetical protein
MRQLSTPLRKYGDVPFEQGMHRLVRQSHFWLTELHDVEDGSAAVEATIENTSP